MILLSKNQTPEKISDVWLFCCLFKSFFFIFQIFADRKVLRAVAFTNAADLQLIHKKRFLLLFAVDKRNPCDFVGQFISIPVIPRNQRLADRFLAHLPVIPVAARKIKVNRLFGFLFLRSLRRTENPVFTRRHMKRPVKQLIKMGHIGKAALSGDFGDRKLAFP